MSVPHVKSTIEGTATSMPQIAFGLYLIPQEETRAVVRAALDAGYRHFDSASFYNNEAEAGAELQKWLGEGHKRSELYITTKVWTTDLHSPEAAVRSAEISIDELGLGYVDLLMVHWPMPGKHVAAYKALEPLASAGKAKALGISNYSPEDFEELIGQVSVPPSVNTFEVNPMLYRKDWIDYFQAKGLLVQAYKPLQRGGDALKADVVSDIAKKHGKTVGQVCIRWAVQKRLVVLVKSSQADRQKENLSVFDFEIAAEDMAQIDALTSESAIATARGHYEKRKSGTSAPWGDGPRPAKRSRAD